MSGAETALLDDDKPSAIGAAPSRRNQVPRKLAPCASVTAMGSQMWAGISELRGSYARGGWRNSSRDPLRLCGCRKLLSARSYPRIIV